MNVPPSILCPIDFSDASRGALRYAAAIADHFGTRLIVMTVEDPLLTEALDLGAGVMWKPEDTVAELSQFAARTFGRDRNMAVTLEYEVAVGKPAEEILRVARERSCDLVVISTHGRTGVRKLFFGSTTERVLRETTKPVLVTPPVDPGPIKMEEARTLLRRILAPIDLSPESGHQVKIAERVAGALGLPLILAHVVEPLRSRFAGRIHLHGLEADRRAEAEDAINKVATGISPRLHVEALVPYGDPAEEIANLARDRQAGMIVMGLHSSPLLGPRMGSVTYRVLCLVPTLVLAIPPQPVHTARATAAQQPKVASASAYRYL